MEKLANFAVIKEKIIKTNELLQMYEEKCTKLNKANRAYKEAKSKYENSLVEINLLKSENERINFSLTGLQPKYDLTKLEHEKLKEQYSCLIEKYNQQLIESQQSHQELQTKLATCKCMIEENTILSPKKKKYKNENDTLNLKLHELEEKLKVAKTNETEYKKKHSDLTQKNQDIMSELVKQKNITNALGMDNSKLKCQVKQFQEKLQELEDANRKKEQRLILENERNLEIEQLRNRLLMFTMVEEQLEKFKSENVLLKQKNNQYQKLKNKQDIGIQVNIQLSKFTKEEKSDFDSDIEIGSILNEMREIPREMCSPFDVSPHHNLSNRAVPENETHIENLSCSETNICEKVIPICSEQHFSEKLPAIIITPPTRSTDNISGFSADSKVHCRQKFRIPYISKTEIVKSRKATTFSHNGRIIKKKKGRSCDTVLKALQTLQKNNINFTITNQSTGILPLQYGKQFPNNLEGLVATETCNTTFEKLTCINKSCSKSNNCMLLKINSGEEELVGFCNMDNQIIHPTENLVTSVNPGENWVGQLLEGIKKLVDSKSHENNLQATVCKSGYKRKRRVFTENTEFCSETESELEKLFKKKNILKRNRMLLNAARKQKMKLISDTVQDSDTNECSWPVCSSSMSKLENESQVSIESGVFSSGQLTLEKDEIYSVRNISEQYENDSDVCLPCPKMLSPLASTVKENPPFQFTTPNRSFSKSLLKHFEIIHSNKTSTEDICTLQTINEQHRCDKTPTVDIYSNHSLNETLIDHMEISSEKDIIPLVYQKEENLDSEIKTNIVSNNSDMCQPCSKISSKLLTSVNENPHLKLTSKNTSYTDSKDFDVTHGDTTPTGGICTQQTINEESPTEDICSNHALSGGLIEEQTQISSKKHITPLVYQKVERSCEINTIKVSNESKSKATGTKSDKLEDDIDRKLSLGIKRDDFKLQNNHIDTEITHNDVSSNGHQKTCANIHREPNRKKLHNVEYIFDTESDSSLNGQELSSQIINNVPAAISEVTQNNNETKILMDIKQKGEDSQQAKELRECENITEKYIFGGIITDSEESGPELEPKKIQKYTTQRKTVNKLRCKLTKLNRNIKYSRKINVPLIQSNHNQAFVEQNCNSINKLRDSVRKVNIVQDILISNTGENIDMTKNRIDGSVNVENKHYIKQPNIVPQTELTRHNSSIHNKNHRFENIKPSTEVDIVTKVLNGMMNSRPSSQKRSLLGDVCNYNHKNINNTKIAEVTGDLAHYQKGIHSSHLAGSDYQSNDDNFFSSIDDCPRSPEILELPDEFILPKIIPVKDHSKLPASKVKVLFEKLLTYSNEEKVLDEIIIEFANQDNDFIAKIILNKLSKDMEKATNQYTPAPVMSETQRILLGFMARLERQHVCIYDKFLDKAEMFLLNKNTCKLEQVEPVTRLFVAVCKLRRDINRVRRLCCEAFYFIEDFAIPLFFTVLTMWSEVLPMATESKDFLLGRVLVQLVFLKTCNKPGYNLLPLRDILHKYFGYPNERQNCDIIYEELFSNYLKNPGSRLSDFSLLIFCKNKPMNWVYQKIKESLIPLIYKIPENNANLKATIVILIANICHAFPKSDESNYKVLTEMRIWFSSLEEECSSEILKKSIQLAISRITIKAKNKKKTENSSSKLASTSKDMEINGKLQKIVSPHMSNEIVESLVE